MFLGATAFGAIARTAWALAPAPTDDDPNRRVLGVVKNNLAMRPANLALTRDEDGPIRWLGTTTDDIELLLQGGNQREAKTPERSDILDVLEEHPEGMTPQQVADALGKNRSTVRTLLQRMSDAGEVARLRTGVYGVSTHITVDNVDSEVDLSTLSTESMSLWQGVDVDSSPGQDRCDRCGTALYGTVSIDRGRCSTCAKEEAA